MREKPTGEFSKEAVTDQPQQRSDVQLQFLLRQVDPQLIQNSGQGCVHIPDNLQQRGFGKGLHTRH